MKNETRYIGKEIKTTSDDAKKKKTRDYVERKGPKEGTRQL